MAGPGDVFERSMSINAKFLPRLQAAVEQNALLRIGWTGSGEEVPKNGEIGLCPAMPEGARIRALGKLGSWTSSFGVGGSFDIEGDARAFFGGYNQEANSQHRDTLAVVQIHDARWKHLRAGW